MAIQKVVFARIGYMHFYCGPQAGDEKPQHGGSYNKDGIGHEAYNFQKLKRMLYGFVQPYEPPEDYKGKITINLERIDPNIGEKDSVKDALVIFVAKSNEYGQVVVGWYNSAIVYRYFNKPDNIKGREFFYNLKTNIKHATLLPLRYRKYKIPSRKKGAFGRANMVYLTDQRCIQRNLSEEKYKWMRDAIDYVGNYSGPNLLTDPDSDTEAEIEDLYDSFQVSRSGQGFIIDSKLRKEIEKYAERKAANYFRRKGYSVSYVGNYRSYDFECVKNRQILRVEVKGTQTKGENIILTKNEVNNAKKNLTALYILHSIRVKKFRKKYILSGGVTRIYNPWKISKEGALSPLSYSYKINI